MENHILELRLKMHKKLILQKKFQLWS